MNRPCSLCGSRQASALTDIDDRLVPACSWCLTPPPAPRYYEPVPALVDKRHGLTRTGPGRRQVRLVDALERLGEGTAGQILAALGVDGKAHAEYDCYSVLISRMVKGGKLVAEGERRKGRTYRLAVAA